MIPKVLGGTQWSVYTVLLILIWLGAQRLSPRVMPWQRAMMTPMVFIIWGVWSLRDSSSSWAATVWAACALLGIGLALLRHDLKGVQIDYANGMLYLAGSFVPLIRNLAIFAAKYGLGVAAALHPEQRAMLTLWSMGVSGVSVGFFLGWLLRIHIVWRNMRRLNLQNVTDRW